ncbi:MAG: hypothetical protein AVDCRST_MAG80-2230, partial [uncultured Rubrobacteraceae bacterium]
DPRLPNAGPGQPAGRRRLLPGAALHRSQPQAPLGLLRTAAQVLARQAL